jgi:hypothetical protein
MIGNYGMSKLASDTVIDLIVEGRNRWSVVLIRIITCIYISSDYMLAIKRGVIDRGSTVYIKCVYFIGGKSSI